MSLGRATAFVLAAWAGLILVSSGQAVLPVTWPLRLPGPDVVLLVVLFVGLSARGNLAGVCALALILGWFADLFAGAPKGLHMATYALAALAARGASSRILVRGHLVTALVAGVFAVASGLVLVLLRVSLAPSLGWSALAGVPGQAAMTLLFAPLVFALLRRIDRRFTRDPRILGGAGSLGTGGFSDGSRLS